MKTSGNVNFSHSAAERVAATKAAAHTACQRLGKAVRAAPGQAAAGLCTSGELLTPAVSPVLGCLHVVRFRPYICATARSGSQPGKHTYPTVE